MPQGKAILLDTCLEFFASGVPTFYVYASTGRIASFREDLQTSGVFNAPSDPTTSGSGLFFGRASVFSSATFGRSGQDVDAGLFFDSLSNPGIELPLDGEAQLVNEVVMK